MSEAKPVRRLGSAMPKDREIAVLKQDVAELRALADELRDRLEETAPASSSLVRQWQELVARSGGEQRPRLTVIDGGGEG